ncbi:MAG: DUF6268 family outer membrane beta-barrel protein [Verrucomicrobiota bacterium]|nr:DUF6268 family outer membrane beta-barrel protein [Verrucomicrobiota bacterium]MDG1891833.1 DUF6268 family outer membrane beta-barrel protein [Verrucomicrobiota bacterium]
MMRAAFARTWGMGLFVAGCSVLANGDDRIQSGSGKVFFNRYEAAWNHQVKSGLQGGGDFAVNRYAARISVGVRSDVANSAALSFGYQQSNYDFSGSGGMSAAGAPVGTVHSLRLGLPLRRQMGEAWTLLAIPSLRTAAEEQADVGQSITGGGIAGLFYEVHPRLRLGPGFGIMGQIEEGASYFPILMVDWAFADRWKLQTGRDFTASQGPGLSVSYALHPSWRLILGVRYERLRFRLDRNGPTPSGVGEDRGVPVYLGARYALGANGAVTLFGGVNIAGEWRVDDLRGRTLDARSYDAAPFFGISAGLRF